MLDSKTQVSDKRRRRRIGVVLFLIWIMASPVIVELADGFLRGILQNFGVFTFDINYVKNLTGLASEKNRQVLFVILTILYAFGLFNLLYKVRPQISDGETIQVANGIRIPTPAGNGQYGTARL